MVEHLTKETFKQKIFNYEESQEWSYNGTLPCIIDFYAEWCGPCKMVSPILDELSKEYEGKLIIYKVNADEEAELSYLFGIRSIPTFIFIPVGDNPIITHGAMQKESFKDIFRKVLKVE